MFNNNSEIVRETSYILHQFGYKESDVLYVEIPAKSNDGYNNRDVFHITYKDFKKNCSHSYNRGFGINYIHLDLKVVLNDGSCMVREEYDGSENWRFIKNRTDLPIVSFNESEMRVTNRYGYDY